MAREDGGKLGPETRAILEALGRLEEEIRRGRAADAHELANFLAVPGAGQYTALRKGAVQPVLDMSRWWGLQPGRRPWRYLLIKVVVPADATLANRRAALYTHPTADAPPAIVVPPGYHVLNDTNEQVYGTIARTQLVVGKETKLGENRVLTFPATVIRTAYLTFKGLILPGESVEALLETIAAAPLRYYIPLWLIQATSPRVEESILALNDIWGQPDWRDTGGDWPVTTGVTIQTLIDTDEAFARKAE